MRILLVNLLGNQRPNHRVNLRDNRHQNQLDLLPNLQDVRADFLAHNQPDVPILLDPHHSQRDNLRSDRRDGLHHSLHVNRSEDPQVLTYPLSTRTSRIINTLS